MKIATIQIKNYRSIRNASINLGEMTVLLGKNNEGKSNLLMAVNIAISSLQEYANMRSIFTPRYYSREDGYIWDRDYPVSERKGKKRDKKTVFVLEFVLDDKEVTEFKRNIGNQLNGTLQIKIVFEEEKEVSITVVKQGKGSKPLNEKSQRVAKYIAEHIEYNYIPAVRTIDHTMEIIYDQIRAQLQEERDKIDYKNALKVISGIENKILLNLSDKIQNALTEFLPDVNTLSLISEDLGMMLRRRQEFHLLINDGEETDLRYKGDGVKSLVAMSLLKNKKTIPNTASVIAIEEPESHLHPSAISALRKAILALSEKSQVIVTTHNPLFVNRNEIESNIIVENGNAVKATNIREIREVLGVKLSDNLYGAKLLLFVEGTTDRTVLNALFMIKSEKLKEALTNNELVIQPMSGTNHIEMHLSLAKSMMADLYVLLDNDDAGRKAIKTAMDKKLLIPYEYMLSSYSDMSNCSEMEDMLDVAIYQEYIKSTYSVDLTCGKFKARNKKWADRIKDVFTENGKYIDADILETIKLKVSQLVAANPEKALRPEGNDFVNKLIQELERIIYP